MPTIRNYLANIIKTDLDCALNIQHSLHQLCVDVPFVKFIGDNIPKHCGVSCPADLQSIEQSTEDHHTPPILPADIDLSPARCRHHAPGVIFLLLTPLFKPLVPLKSRVYDMVISLYTCWNTLNTCDRIFPSQNKNFRFIRCPVLIVCSSELTVNNLKK